MLPILQNVVVDQHLVVLALQLTRKTISEQKVRGSDFPNLVTVSLIIETLTHFARQEDFLEFHRFLVTSAKEHPEIMVLVMGDLCGRLRIDGVHQLLPFIA